MQEDTCKLKFEKLQSWGLEIFQAIRKEIKSDHMRNDLQFTRKYFSKKDPAKASVEDLCAACLTEVNEGNEEFGQWLISRWVVKNSDLYQLFAVELSKINPEFDQIEVIPEAVADQLIRQSIAQFGASNVYIFSVLNTVHFSKEIYEKLHVAAENEKKTQAVSVKTPETSVEEVKKYYEGAIEKLTGKYEKKLQGLEQKYFNDMEGLKKQISNLHKKIDGCKVS